MSSHLDQWDVPKIKTWSCGCQTYTDEYDGCPHVIPCSPDCLLYLKVLELAREMGKKIVQVREH